MAFKPIDPKRDDFRRYLERYCVIEALTKAFVRLIKERPENPMEYLRSNLGESLLQADNLTYLENELAEARGEIQRLRTIIQAVNPEALEELREEAANIEELAYGSDESDLDGSGQNSVGTSTSILAAPSKLENVANEQSLEETENNYKINEVLPDPSVPTQNNVNSI